MGNVLSAEKRQQVIALGRLGWSLRRIEETTGVRRETVSAYLKAAGIDVRPPRYKETNVGRAIPAPILTALLDSETLTRRWPARGTFFRFAYLSGVRRGQLLATRLAQFQAQAGTMTWRPEQTKTEDAHNVTYAGDTLELLRWFWERRNLACPAF